MNESNNVVTNANQEEEEVLDSFVSVAPGRVCLFGEHQDYLGLPVIAAALPLSCQIHVTPMPKSRILQLYILDHLVEPWTLDLDDIPTDDNHGRRAATNNDDDAEEEMDFALAAVQEVLKEGWIIPHGAKCISTTTLPLQAGCSSSSAFCVAWIQALAKLSHHHHQPHIAVTITPLKLAQLAHRAEVTHFGNPGGTMDHVTSAMGGVLRIGPGMWQVQHLVFPANTAKSREGGGGGVWVLADSGQPKDTLGHLKRCKQDRLDLLTILGGNWDADDTTLNLTSDQQSLLNATRTNRDMEQLAFHEWTEVVAVEDDDTSTTNTTSRTTTLSGQRLGRWMLQHHEALRDGLQLSTPRLERMREAALDAGAWGFKLVGSGGGGCAVAWTPIELSGSVAASIKMAGAVQTWILSESCPGAHVILKKKCT